MNHLTRILEDLTDAVERFCMRWKEKSLTIVAGPLTEYKPGDNVEIKSNSGTRWILHVVEGMEALGTWLDNRCCSEAGMWHWISKAKSMFYAKKAVFCDPKLPVKRRIDAFYSTCIDWRFFFSRTYKVKCRVSWGVRFAPLDLTDVFILSHSCSCRRFELLFLRETHMCVICPDVCHFFSFSLFCVWALKFTHCVNNDTTVHVPHNCTIAFNTQSSSSVESVLILTNCALRQNSVM